MKSNHKEIRWVRLALLSAGALPILVVSSAGGHGGDEGMEQVMQRVMQLATPGQHHSYLKPLAGQWKLATRFHMTPDAPWDESTGDSTIRWILGGRFLQQTVDCPPSGAMPVPFEGFGLLGFDNRQKKYINLWTDSFTTGMILFDGTSDASGKVITLTGEAPDPIKEGAMKRGRWVYRIINADKFTFEMWEPDEHGKEFLHGEITYTRVK